MTVKEPSLKKNFSWTLLGNVTYAASLWGVLVILTKLGSPEMVGRFSLGSAIATPLIMFVGLQFKSVFVTDADDQHSFRDYLGIRLFLLPLTVLVIAVIGLVGYTQAQALAITVFACARSIEAISDLYYGLFQKNERMDLMARSLLIKGPASLILFGVVFWLTGNLVGALAGMGVGWALALVLFDIPWGRRIAAQTGIGSIRPRLSWPTFREIVWLSFPLGVVMLLLQLRNTIPRTVLEAEFGEGPLGIFSALSYLVIAGSTVALALSQSSIARLSRYYAADDGPRFRATVWKLVLLGSGLCVGGVLVAVLFGRPLLNLIYTAEFAEHSELFVVIMAAGGLVYIGNLLGAPATAMRAFRSQMVIMLFNAAFMLGLALWLIPRHGMMGAAWTMMGGAVWVVVAYGALIWHRQRRMGDGS